MKRVTVKTSDSAVTLLIPDMALSVCLERKPDGWYAELEFPNTDPLKAPERYPLGLVPPAIV